MAIIFKNIKLCNNFKKYLQKKNIAATFHYVPLHNSKMGRLVNKKRLTTTENLYKRVVRLPLFPGMKNQEFNKIKKEVKSFFKAI